jgi:hypothetical protein
MTAIDPEQPEPTDDFARTPEQKDTVAHVDRLLGHAVANRYVDFCRLAAAATGLHVGRPLAAHALRELESMLRSSLKVPMEADQEPPKDARAAEARTALQALGYDKAKVDEALKRLAPRVTQATEIRAIAERLGLAGDSDVVKAWIDLCETFGRAHERSFHRSLAVDDDFRQMFQRPFEYVLRSVVLALQKRYAALMQRTQQIAVMSDYRGAIRHYEREIPGALPLQWHFFQAIQSPRWLPHLLERNLTGEPLAVIDGAGTNNFREWPVGYYLLHIARGNDRDAQVLIAEAIRRVASSRYPDVRQQGQDIVAALPPDISVGLADVVIGWLDPGDQNYSQLGPHAYIKRLAEAGFSAQAVLVAGAVFQVFDRSGRIASLHPDGMYEHHLLEAVKVLAPAAGLAALDLFSNLLIRSETIAQRYGDDAYDDYTYITPHPLSDNQMATYGVTEGLTIAVRDTALAICAQGAENIEAVVNRLLGFAPKLFKRIALHVASKFAAAIPALSTALLLDQSYIGQSWCEEEYAELAKAHFSKLTAGERVQVLKIVDALPDAYREGWAQRFEEQKKTAPAAADIRTFDQCVVRDALWKWKDVLPADRRKAVEEVAQEFGSPDDWRERLFPSETSPATVLELSSQPVSALVSFLKTWTPQDKGERQIAALGNQLRTAVENQPEQFAAAADLFAPLRPIYVRRVLEGLDSKVRNGASLVAWKPLLDLMLVVTSRLKPSENETSFEGDDANWIWAAHASVTLLKSALRQGAAGIPYEHAPAVLKIIKAVFSDAPRTPESKDFEENFWKHPYFSSEQSLWGSAIELAVLFVFWSSKFPDSGIAQEQRSALERLPEIRALLEAALSDASAAGRIPRAIIGRYTNWLFYFGEGWLREQLPEIFHETQSDFRRAAWHAHLMNDSGPAKEMVEPLLLCYLEEIERLSSGEKTSEIEQRQRRLGDYVMILVLSGVAPKPLMDAFFGKASPQVRAHSLSFLGREFALPPEKLPADVRARGVAYWEERLAAALQSGQSAAFQQELGVISQWCAKENIEPGWLLDQLLRMMDGGFSPKAGFTVIDWLGKNAAAHPDKCVAVLLALLNSPKLDRWTYMAHSEAIKLVLQTGLSSGTPSTVQRVKEIISLLSTLGQSGYLALLRADGPDGS